MLVGGMERVDGASVIGGIALLLIQVGVEGLCQWSKQAVSEAAGIEKSE